jgi:hypothetical protein
MLLFDFENPDAIGGAGGADTAAGSVVDLKRKE